MRKVLVAFAILVTAHRLFAGGEHSGQVLVGSIPVPGATVTASAGDKKLVTSTDEEGKFKLPDATAGVWTLRVEMLGFEPLTREITVTTEPQPSTWTLTLKPFDDITRGIPIPSPAVAAVAPPTNGSAPKANTPSRAAASAAQAGRGGFQRAGVTATPTNRASALSDEPPPPPEAAQGATDGFLINGSVNNGAASPFAQAAAFGNNRRGRGSLFNYQFAIVEGNSAFDASPFSVTNQTLQKSNYNDLHLSGTFGGPLRFRHFMPNKGPNVFFAYQHGDDHNATTQPGVVPTALERAGDFSQTVTPLGQPVQIVDPSSGKPFNGNVIPSTRISPQAAALLSYYPLPNISGTGFNFEAPLTTFTRQEQFTSRVTQPLDSRNQLIGLLAYQHNSTQQTTVFGFNDSSLVSGVDGSLTWTHRVNQFLTLRPRFQYTELTNSTTPYFANRLNVSGLAGITGNNQDPPNWGPPSLNFSTINPGLSDAVPNFNRNRTVGGGGEAYWSRGRHNFTFGGDVRRVMVDVESQQNPRGSFTFTGAVTGYDFADFLLGTPTTSSIAFGNADKFLRAYSSDAYVTDDWRFSPTLTMQIGVRWEYDTPIDETLGRLANLAVTPGFTSATPVVGDGLLQPDRRGVQPRVGIAWRPIPGSSLVIRAGYGIYRNQNVYQPIELLLAQQPPFSKAFQLANSPTTPLSLANGFNGAAAANTFAVDPNLRVGESQNWQALIQRDMPGSLTITGTYLGNKGSDLLQEFLPNTYPLGAANPCVSCPSGFVYLVSNGTSSRHAGQLQLRRRLRNGFLASVQYTLSKATDNATAFGGVSLAGSAIAQDWRNLDAETGPSNFDQRHQVTATVQYTTGMGLTGGTLLEGWKGKLYKGWTITGQLTTGSGLPFTPVYFASVSGSGVTGSIRPSFTGASASAPAGYYLNPSAYTAPAPGQWGNVGRNSVTGPAQFAFNAGITRTFQFSEKTSFDWRLDATNVLNRVTYTGVDAVLGGPQFGLPTLTNNPRKIVSTMRLRF